jgi:Flp pilus assembly protein TadD
VALMELAPDSPARELAKPTLETAVQAETTDAKLPQVAGDLFMLGGDYGLAASCYRKALALDPSSVAARNNLALAWAEQRGDFAEAQRMIEQTIQEHGANANLMDSKAAVLLLAGQTQQAVETLQQAISTNPDDPLLFLHLAMALDQLKAKPEARAAFLQSLALGIRTQWLTPRDRSFLAEQMKLLPQSP